MSPSGPDNALRYVAYHTPGGLDLTSAPDSVDGAIDMLNVDLDRKGAVRSRNAWVPREPEADTPILAFHHGRVQEGSDAGDVTVMLTSGTKTAPWDGSLYGTGAMKVVSNELVSDTYASAIYDLSVTDGEVSITLPNGPAQFEPPGLLIRTSNESSPAANGYRFIVVLQGIFAIERIGGGKLTTTFDAGTTMVGAGDSIGLRAVGGTLQAWHKPSAGSWTKILEVTDPNPITSGRVGVMSYGRNVFDSFCGGATTGSQAPSASVLDNFNRSDEDPVGGGPQLVAYNHDQQTDVSAAAGPAGFFDAVQYSTATKSVILATTNVVTGTNLGIDVIEVSGATPYVSITPLPWGGGPPTGPDLEWVRFVDVQHPDNRAVAVGVGKGKHSESEVWFSNPESYTAWNADNYVQLAPNDGEVFTGTANWRGQLWVFKESQAFVFYGNSVDQFGGVIFNYRTVSLGARAVPRNLTGAAAFGSGVAAGRDGVYFVGTDGIYLTDGRDPVNISRPIEAVLEGTWGSVELALGGSADALQAGLHYADGRLYVNVGRLVFVYDEALRGWMLWQSPLTDGEDPASGAPSYWIGSASSNSDLPALSLNGHPAGDRLWSLAAPSEAGVVTEDGRPIPCRYRSGFSAMGSDYIDRLVQARVWGVGDVDVTVSKDFERTGISGSLALGGSSYLDVPSEGTVWLGMSGVMFSHELAGDAPWAVHRLVLAVSSQEAPGSAQ